MPLIFVGKRRLESFGEILPRALLSNRFQDQLLLDRRRSPLHLAEIAGLKQSLAKHQVTISVDPISSSQNQEALADRRVQMAGSIEI